MQNDFIKGRQADTADRLGQQYQDVDLSEEGGNSGPRQKRLDLSEQEKANAGLVWRKLGGDVTRAPVRGNLFAVAMAIGAQVLFCWVILLFFFQWNLLLHLSVRPFLFYFTVVLLACSGLVNGSVLG